MGDFAAGMFCGGLILSGISILIVSDYYERNTASIEFQIADLQSQAIAAGAAEFYIVDANTGATEFRWKTRVEAE